MKVQVTNDEGIHGKKSWLVLGQEHLVAYVRGLPGGKMGYHIVDPKYAGVNGVAGDAFRVVDMRIPKQWVFAVTPEGRLLCGPKQSVETPGLIDAAGDRGMRERDRARAYAGRARYRDRTDALQELLIAWPQSRNAHEAGLIASRSVATQLLAGNCEPELAASKLQSLVEQIPTIAPFIEPFLDQVAEQVRGESRHERTGRLKDAAHHLSSTLHDAEQGRTPRPIDPTPAHGRDLGRDGQDRGGDLEGEKFEIE